METLLDLFNNDSTLRIKFNSQESTSVDKISASVDNSMIVTFGTWQAYNVFRKSHGFISSEMKLSGKCKGMEYA